MHELIASGLDVCRNESIPLFSWGGLEIFLKTFIASLFFYCGLVLWDKNKFPFRWSRVLGICILYLSGGMFLFDIIRTIKMFS